jgi:hypothetical protein
MTRARRNSSGSASLRDVFVPAAVEALPLASVGPGGARELVGKVVELEVASRLSHEEHLEALNLRGGTSQPAKNSSTARLSPYPGWNGVLVEQDDAAGHDERPEQLERPFVGR